MWKRDLQQRNSLQAKSESFSKKILDHRPLYCRAGLSYMRTRRLQVEVRKSQVELGRLHVDVRPPTTEHAAGKLRIVFQKNPRASSPLL